MVALQSKKGSFIRFKWIFKKKAQRLCVNFFLDYLRQHVYVYGGVSRSQPVQTKTTVKQKHSRKQNTLLIYMKYVKQDNVKQAYSQRSHLTT